MMREADKIILHGLRFYGYHGLLPEEKSLGQWFEVDVEIWGDLSKAAESDNVDDTLNYQQVYKDIKAIVEGKPVNLLEHLTHKIILKIMELPLPDRVLVRVKKPTAPIKGPLGYAGVEMIRSRDEY
ncbi:MAG TPA: dihydroneopterin aldolase [Peptococcaceae bacterium]|jgi:dihydroneopterin aldolase|nr:dihydroneopterin aldolase [Peptococcaceae bacterium]HPZ71394.1 dihydroneopterin aldolase [Peptococcaceae bacterium]HQD54615.1 dihydroneopterin aldolase [Peptococcaceae bacterium]